MLAWGTIGLFAGLPGLRGLLRKKALLATYGVLAGIGYSGIMDIWNGFQPGREMELVQIFDRAGNCAAGHDYLLRIQCSIPNADNQTNWGKDETDTDKTRNFLIKTPEGKYVEKAEDYERKSGGTSTGAGQTDAA